MIVLVVGGAIAVVVVERPTLEDARDAVDDRWKPLQVPLANRYEKLTTAQAALVAAGFGDRSVSQRSRARPRRLEGRRRRRRSRDRSGGGEPPGGRRKRLEANVFGSPVLAKVAGLSPAITGFDSAAPRQPLVDVYNQAVRATRGDRNDSLRKPVARLFGSTPARCS